MRICKQGLVLSLVLFTVNQTAYGQTPTEAICVQPVAIYHSTNPAGGFQVSVDIEVAYGDGYGDLPAGASATVELYVDDVLFDSAPVEVWPSAREPAGVIDCLNAATTACAAESCTPLNADCQRFTKYFLDFCTCIFRKNVLFNDVPGGDALKVVVVGPGVDSFCPDASELVVAFVPTVSEWGVVAMALLVLTAGTVVLSRTRRVVAQG